MTDDDEILISFSMAMIIDLLLDYSYSSKKFKINCINIINIRYPQFKIRFRKAIL